MTDGVQQFDYEVNLLQAILWQYNNAPHLLSILNNKAAWYAAYQQGFWQDWDTDVFNLATANDFGLAVWAIILGRPIVTAHSPAGERDTWGFGSFHVNFNRGNFLPTGGVYRLATETARILLQIRYFQLTSSGTVPEINRMLKYLFAEKYGNAWLVDNHNMTQVYNFDFALPSDLQYVFIYFDVLPRPAGVSSSFVVI